MVQWFVGLSPVWQAGLATCCTWLLTAVGAATVFAFRSVPRRVLDSMLGFAAGVMIAASYWSLLAPAVQMAQRQHGPPAWIPVAVGFLLGGASLWAIDRVLPHLHLQQPTENAEGVATTWRRSVLLVLAITLHNIPEGLAVGVAFGALAHHLPSASLTAALTLALGIGIQNLPEGMAVAVPLRRDGVSRLKCFWYGQLSAVVEPVAGLMGAAAVIVVQALLPYALAFAAGAMLYVVVEELIPESQMRDTDTATAGAMVGFALMMSLEVAFG